MDEFKVELVGREVIKPASPSPRDRLQLSIFDHNCPTAYVRSIFFYKAEEDLVTSSKLKSSLSKTLSRFYPLAGRIEGVSISCNDEGVIFDEARTDLLLPDFLRNLKTNFLDCLTEPVPTMEPSGYSAAEWPLLTVKVTYFGSGSGVAVSVSVSHKICDAASLLTFLKDWATTTAKGESNDERIIQFAETTIYPPPPPTTPHSSSDSFAFDSVFDLTKRCVLNRFVFESSKIAELKREAASKSVQVPTRVEAITSLIWRCARTANSHSSNNLVVPRSTSMTQAVDLRLRIPSTVLPPDAIGNLQTIFFLKRIADSELEIRETVVAFRKTKEKLNEMIKKSLEKNTLGQNLLIEMENCVSEFKPDIDVYAMSSWCGKPFYEVDFGWGNPVWMGPAIPTIADVVCIVLFDSKDGEGIEAWINLPEQDMSLFVHDQELLAYAILNPPVLI